MSDQPTNQPSRADEIRRQSTEQEKKIVAAFEKAAAAPKEQQTIYLIQAVAACSMWAFSWLPEITAELAEMNSRDREAEIRAKTAEAFVAGIQEELRRQGIVMAAGMPNVKTPRGR